jgi:LmbE family N-acetylglucosaminyl deacetylase
MKHPGTVVIVVPHQDDEMFIFHRIRVLLTQRRNLHLIWVTDGAAHTIEVRRSYVIRLFFPILSNSDDATIRAVRMRESIALAHQLAIPDQHLRFLAFPSGRIQNCFGQVVDALHDIFQKLQPLEVYTVAFDHSHFEHDACNAAVRLAANEGSCLYEFPVLNLSRGLGRHRWLVPCAGTKIERTPFTWSEERRRLRLFRRIFKSQWSVALLEAVGSCVPSDYRKFGEPYRLIPDHDYTRPLDGNSIHYLPASLDFTDFRRMVLPYLHQKCSPAGHQTLL